jgi:hypothetical protein
VMVGVHSARQRSGADDRVFARGPAVVTITAWTTQPSTLPVA